MEHLHTRVHSHCQMGPSILWHYLFKCYSLEERIIRTRTRPEPSTRVIYCHITRLETIVILIKQHHFRLWVVTKHRWKKYSSIVCSGRMMCWRSCVTKLLYMAFPVVTLSSAPRDGILTAGLKPTENKRSPDALLMNRFITGAEKHNRGREDEVCWRLTI